MIPLWKLRREWASLKQQLQAVPERLIGPARQRRLDARFPADCRVQDGDRGLGDRVAIFLVFQPAGLSESCRQTCEHLARHGYAVLLVANHALRDMDVQGLRPVVWRFVQRPNFGYDFGGYRDGIRLLQHWGIEPEQVVMFNDSIWYPVVPHDRLLPAMETSAASFTGAFRFVDPPGQDAEHAGIFLSYFFHFKRALWTSEVFRRYWAGYVCSSNKVLTVKRGERGFSRTLMAAGVPSEGIHSRDRLMACLRGLPPAELRKVLDYAAYTDEPLQRAGDALLAEPLDAPGWQQRALAHLQAAVERRNPVSTLCYAGIRWMGVPYLKKNAGELQVRMRRQYLRAVQAGDLPDPGEAVLAEVRARTPGA
ncbi:MAG: hypothetical protein KGZ46_04315 [Hydrogenophaga sp.]|jgi:hypothetical protein|nr:hypothetical protein [Comamonadaceae bacterium]MBS4037349.1 hypothetical protein [Hydrogenophaga sp.]